MYKGTVADWQRTQTEEMWRRTKKAEKSNRVQENRLEGEGRARGRGRKGQI
jgi:hypothetical protein